MLTASDTHSSTKKKNSVRFGFRVAFWPLSAPFTHVLQISWRTCAGTCSVHTQQGVPPPPHGPLGWNWTTNWTCDIRTKHSDEDLTCNFSLIKSLSEKKTPARAAKSASLISERGVNICYSPLKTIWSPSLALALAASHCAAAICLSAVGPCYLLFPFWSRSFSARGPSRHRRGRGGTSVPGG